MVDKRKCWNCGKMTNIDDLHYYYHGDQDDLVCGDCAKNLKHSDTAYAGMNVYKTSVKR